MKVFWGIVLFIKVIVLLLLILFFLPFVLLWFWIRGKIYRASMRRELRKSGLPPHFVKEALNEMRILNLIGLSVNTDCKKYRH